VNVVPEDIASALDIMGRWRPDVVLDVRWFDSVASTMDVAANLTAAEHAQVVVAADEQTGGRGRRGHTWHSPPGAGLYLSWVARPALDASAVPLVTLAAGVGVREGILRATGLAAELKWPNDLLVAGRKVAGILAEGVAIGSPGQAVVIGVGVNVRHAIYPQEIAARATSLEVELGWPPERGQLLVEILCGLIDRVAELQRDRDAILRAWREAAPSADGAPIEWTDVVSVKHGTTAGIDESGALLIRTPDGIDKVVGGEVRWIER
jgi:BirA family biotin operon repressor/biotin-[acetyl-CoA-carboxylase] ligase